MGLLDDILKKAGDVGEGFLGASEAEGERLLDLGTRGGFLGGLPLLGPAGGPKLLPGLTLRGRGAEPVADDALSFTEGDVDDGAKAAMSLGLTQLLTDLQQKFATGTATAEDTQQFQDALLTINSLISGDDQSLEALSGAMNLLTTTDPEDIGSIDVLKSFSDFGGQFLVGAEEEISPEQQRFTDLTIRQLEADTAASELILKNAERDSERAAVESFLSLVPSRDRMAIIAGMLEKPRFQELFFGGFAGVDGTGAPAAVPGAVPGAPASATPMADIFTTAFRGGE